MSFQSEHQLFARWNLRAPTVGALALSCLGVAILSGALLTPLYSLGRAFDSLQILLVSNPAGTLIRSLHYWAGQLFLILTALHVVEYLYGCGERQLRWAVWLRLTAVLPFSLYVMVSGYVLKGDGEGELAGSVLTGLLESIPGIGSAWVEIFVGRGDDLTVIAIQHGATATLLILALVFEHYRRLWPSASAWLLALAICLVASLLLPPGLSSVDAAVTKGPWYLLGVQELLHWLADPGPLWIVGGLWLLGFAVLPVVSPAAASRIKRSLGYAFLAYLVLVGVGAFLRGENWRWQTFAGESPFTSPRVYLADGKVEEHILPVVLGRREGCLVCHSDETGLASAHSPEAIGCASCHGGDPWTANESLAHSGMHLVPGNLESAERACGADACHPSQVDRVAASPMATGRGLVAVDRFVFGEIPTPDGHDTLADLKDSPADRHLQELCAGCHLGVEKTDLGPVGELSRGGGCLACHLVYDGPVDKVHSRLTVAVGDEHCFGCHSRSGRISTSYEGWHESGRPADRDAESLKEDEAYRILDDGRVFARRPEDVHHAAGLACIDCHTQRELMGDGREILHEEDAIEIACLDCHRETEASLATWQELDEDSRRVLQLRYGPQAEDRQYLLAESSRLALVNIWPDVEGPSMLTGKLTGKRHELKPPLPVCGQAISGHDRLSCSSCHSAWVPTCLGCHTQATPEGWQELGGSFLTGPPTLGVREDGQGGTSVVPFAPGMIMTLGLEERQIDGLGFESLQAGGRFVRLFAPVAPHTTSKKGMTCEACHLSPVVLGLGSGVLEYRTEGEPGFSFEATWGPLRDGLPADAWTGFLESPTAPWSTRSDARPLSPDEQKRVLLVAACLSCHPDSEVSRGRIYGRYEQAIDERSERCVIPKGWVLP